MRNWRSSEQVLSMLSTLSSIQKNLSEDHWEKALECSMELQLGAEALITIIKQEAKNSSSCLACKERANHGSRIQEGSGD